MGMCDDIRDEQDSLEREQAGLPDVSTLWYGCEDTASRNYDWSRGYGENWTSYEAVEVECEGGTVENDEGEDVPCTFTGTVVVSSGCWECPECDEQHDGDSAEGPMMNYCYALPDHASIDSDDAAKLAGTCLCLVNFHGEDEDGIELPTWALALTGGGMDLSWDIAEAHMRLGYMPPSFVCNLPNYAGSNYSDPLKLWIIAGCRRTGEAIRNHGQDIIDRLERLTAP